MKAIMMKDVEIVCKNCFLKHFVKCNGWKERHEECPWKPLPQKKEVNLELDYDAYYQIGWNECLEEIEND